MHMLQFQVEQGSGILCDLLGPFSVIFCLVVACSCANFDITLFPPKSALIFFLNKKFYPVHIIQMCEGIL